MRSVSTIYSTRIRVSERTAMSIRPPLRHRLIACLVLCAVAWLVTGCGQMGDLYLPDESQEQQKKKRP
jgi:predicted small lipoprotein YifL